MNRTAISVIVPIYKGMGYISGLVLMLKENSTRFHEYYNDEIELILVNDFPDEDISIEKKNDLYFSIKIVDNKINRGIHGARITGLKQARGEYVVFLDQDDEISNNYIMSQYKKVKGFDASLCNGVIQGRKRKKKIIYPCYESQKNAIEFQYIIALDCQIVSPGQVMMRRDKVPDEWKTLVMRQNGVDDYFLWILMITNNVRFQINREILFYHNFHGGNTSLRPDVMSSSRQEMLALLKQSAKLDQLNYDILKSGIEQRQNTIRYLQLLKLTSKWLTAAQAGKTLASYFRDRGYNSIAVYGLGELGRRLYTELYKTEIEILYAIDRNKEHIKADISIYSPEDELEFVDAVIVTAVSFFEEIKQNIEKKVNCPIISLETIVNDVMNEDI